MVTVSRGGATGVFAPGAKLENKITLDILGLSSQPKKKKRREEKNSKNS